VGKTLDRRSDPRHYCIGESPESDVRAEKRIMNQASPTSRLLIIEDDAELGAAMLQQAEQQGYVCTLASSGAEGVRLAEQEEYTVIVVDLTLDDESGLRVLRRVREANEGISLLILTQLEMRQERLAGLEAGADDFLLKPFSMEELRARLEAAVIRSARRIRSELEIGPVYMDLTSRKARRSGRLLALTPTEFRILEILMRNHGTAVTRRVLVEFLWQPEWGGGTNVIEVHINRLRNKLSNGGTEPQLIFTQRGSGYLMHWDPDAPPPPPPPPEELSDPSSDPDV